ncbi:hypothetical protein L7F22_044368 [Adiantum nelumboides]|nr:hypothetical protein [Adiantum nelumboides]
MSNKKLTHHVSNKLLTEIAVVALMQSTGSFFPEKTMTLDSLIGFAEAATTHPSFHHSLGDVGDTSSMIARPRRLIARFARRRSEPSGPTGTSKSTSWSNVIRCKSCRGTFDYPDDDSSVDAPPSLGHFLDRERDLEAATNNQAKVYINVMFEEDGHSSHENQAINPLFDSERVSSPSLVNNLGNDASSRFFPTVHHVVHSSSLRAEDAAHLQEPMSTRDYNHQKQSNEATNQNVEILRLQDAARSIQSFQKATTMLKSKSQRQPQGQLDRAGICMLSCVSHIWGSSKSTSNLRNSQYEDDDIDSQCSSEESNCKLEPSAPLNRGISCYTNFSFDDSDCSVYFDDEDDVNTSGDSRDQDTTDSNDAGEFEFRTPAAQSTRQMSVNENKEVKIASVLRVK